MVVATIDEDILNALEACADVLRGVKSVIEREDNPWWFGLPDRGGVDSDAIGEALARLDSLRGEK